MKLPTTNFLIKEQRKLLATLLVIGFYLFFWLNGPINQTLDILNLEQIETEFSAPQLVKDGKERISTFGTVDDADIKGFGHSLIVDNNSSEDNYGILGGSNGEKLSTSEYRRKLIEHARELIPGGESYEVARATETDYVIVHGKEKKIYLESKGDEGIRGYAGIIKVGLVVNENGALDAVNHISSKETESYLQKIKRTGYYEQFHRMTLVGNHQIDAVSGATLTSEAIAKTAAAVLGNARPEPLVNFAGINDLLDFSIEAKLTWWWILHISVIFLLFLYGFQKKLRKSKKGVMAISFLSVIYIGFFLNNSFTYISFIHPFVGSSISSLTGLYALFTLIGAIWGKNTYCKYVCPFGNAQRLILQATPKKFTTRFFISNKWIKRIRDAITIVLITGVLLGLRGWSNFELFPDFFGLDYRSWWFIVALFAVFFTMRYPMIWCRLLCPTGSVLDFIAETVTVKRKK